MLAEAVNLIREGMRRAGTGAQYISWTYGHRVWTYDEIRDTLMSRDCGFGKCLDGGGSSSLVFEKQLLNKPAAGSERPVTDFLYFTE
jgi:hypothetical protein